MAELMLVNPRRRRRRTSRRRRVRVTRARRNPRRMSALQARYFGGGRRRRHRRRAPSERQAAAALFPRRRRARRHHRVSRRRSYLRMGGKLSIRNIVNSTLIPAGVGAAGALGVDLLVGYFGHALPPSMQSGILNSLVRIAGAVGVGYAAGMVAGKKFGEEAMAGAITVTVYDIAKSLVKKSLPSLPLSGYDMGWVSPAWQVGGYGSGMGYYVGRDNAYSGSMTQGTSMGMYVGGEDESMYYR